MQRSPLRPSPGRRVALALALARCALSATPALAATLTVGPGKQYARPCQAIAAAQPGDVIEVDAGRYDGDTCAWSTDRLTVRGVGGRARIDLTGVEPAGDKGIFTIAAAAATIESFELSGAAIAKGLGGNAAGIRHQGGDLTVRDCYLHDNQNGILGAPAVPGEGAVLIERTEVARNGAGDGYTHNLYLGDYASFTLQYSYSHGARVGHLVKSRARYNLVQYNRLTDEAGGTASYEVDLPNGGESYLIGNLIEQSATTMNSTLVAYEEEGRAKGYDDHLVLVNNTLLNDRKSGTFVDCTSGRPALIVNNIFWNGGSISSLAATLVSNWDASVSGDPRFVDVAHLDVHLRPDSPLIDQGSDPGMGMSMSLQPLFHYVHPLSSEARVVAGTRIDIGACEFGNVASDLGVPPDLAPPRDLAGVVGADLAGAAHDLAAGRGDLGGGGGAGGGCGCALGARREPGGRAGGRWPALAAAALLAFVRTHGGKRRRSDGA